MCDRLDVIYECFAYVKLLYLCIRLVRNGSFLHPFVLHIKISVYVGLFMIWSYLMRASAGMTSWMTLEFITISGWKPSYMFINISTSLWPLVDVQTFLHYLYTFRIHPWIYDKNLTFKGLGWRLVDRQIGRESIN